MFLEEGPHYMPLPHEKFFSKFYCAVPDVLHTLFPDENMQYGMISNGDRSVAKLTFRMHSGQPLPDYYWNTLKKHMCVYLAQDPELAENMTLEYLDNDTSNKGYQTMVLTKQ